MNMIRTTTILMTLLLIVRMIIIIIIITHIMIYILVYYIILYYITGMCISFRYLNSVCGYVSAGAWPWTFYASIVYNINE